MLGHSGLLHLSRSKSYLLQKLAKEMFLKKFLSTSFRSMGAHASLKVHNQIGIVTLNSPGKVNVINMEVVKDMEEILPEIEQNPDIKGGVLISNKPDCFIAGADINLLSTIKSAEEGSELSEFTQEFLERIETSKKPMVAAIMGSCLGGGLEVALACHYRLAIHGRSMFGFPEVMLGLLPGAGGTQRLPRLTGLPDALDMMLTGKNIRPDKAKSMGFIDQLIYPLGPGTQEPDQRTLEYLEEIAIKVCLDLANGDLKVNRNPKNIFDIALKKAMETKYARNYIFNQARKKVMKQTHGLYPAPLQILDVVRRGLEDGVNAGYAAEAAGFGELTQSKESKGLISLFFGQTECKKNKAVKSEREINTIAVIGAGLMGAGIADVSIRKGYRTILKDATLEGLTKGESDIQNGIELSQKKKRLSKIEGEKILSNLIPTITYDKFHQADIVIEAVFEDLDLKHRVLREVENVVPEHCVYATNTSALLLKDIAKASKRPDKVIGMHYFSPVDKMQLLEIVTTESTSEDTLKTAIEVGLRHGKVPIRVKDGPGFYTTRVIMPMVTEGFRLMLEGGDPERLDKLSMDLGFPIGLVTLSDEVGIDVGYHVYRYFVDVFGERMKVVDMTLGREITNAGILGKKSGKGAYLYKEGSGKIVNQEALDIMSRFKVEPKLPLTDENIQNRMMSRFVNEAVMCLQEGIISNPLEGDVGAVFGLGFPPFTGGPFHYLDSFGADKFVAQMRKLEAAYGPSFTPCQLLLDHANDPTKKFFSS